jgi:cation diffusion facilitator CzcD-associated flavoprotein CzcO
MTIGAGLSGIQMAYQIQKYTENVEHVIYEKNPSLGGTWLENRYPGTLLFFSYQRRETKMFSLFQYNSIADDS